ncbi:hypothetical protein KDW_49730 [Dictyobacter vulcani]|uniref:DUF2332 domain-containing protein n=1 Tax=Dictyobacter vulcani TaxID=2607529 RepID=A0A5J4KWF7_9CHLR|nr:DUF2332 domain-containing protein [Dictyobacter vulcani]GER90811.1 hypothetical protein KDW_49730 [Dictyobacter vulcani]
MSQSHLASGIENLARQFQVFAQRESDVNPSPLYSILARNVAKDSTMLTLASHARPGQPVPNIFFAAVHYLLLSGTQHPLAAFYPSLTALPAKLIGVYPIFRAFCQQYEDQLREIISTRRVQTNEICRCACLLPMFEIVSQLGRKRPLAIIEIGTSAGLNLLWDQYGYRYGDVFSGGNRTSALQLDCELRGPKVPPLPPEMPEVTLRVGLDLHPINISNPDAVLWLRALIWPEHKERFTRLQNALEIVRQQRPLVLAGDALKLLPTIMANVPMDTTLCIFHSFTFNQIPEDARQEFSNILISASRHREIFRIAYEAIADGTDPTLDLSLYLQGLETRQTLARAAAHGSWMEWLA